MKTIVILLFLLTVNICANIGNISALKGEVSITRSNEIIKANIGTILHKYDTIQTTQQSNAQIILKDNTVITVGKNSALKIEEYVYDIRNPKSSKTVLNFFKGSFKTITGHIGKINRDKFRLKTKTANIGIRGTVVIGNQKIIACSKGAISVTSLGEIVFVNANQITRTLENKPPSIAEPLTRDTLEDLETSLHINGWKNNRKNPQEAKHKKEPERNGNDNNEHSDKDLTHPIKKHNMSEEKEPLLRNQEKIQPEINQSEDFISKTSLSPPKNPDTVLEIKEDIPIHSSSPVTTEEEKITGSKELIDINNLSLIKTDDNALENEELTSMHRAEFPLPANIESTESEDHIPPFIEKEPLPLSSEIDKNDNFEILEDEHAWGYWTQESSSPESHFNFTPEQITELKTHKETVQDLIDGTPKTFDFSGQAMGQVHSNDLSNHSEIIVDSNNLVNLSFDFGGGTGSLTGSMQFNTEDGNDWSVSIGNGSATSQKFSSSSLSGTGANNVISSGMIIGDYLGSEEIQNVNGQFDISTSSHRAEGTFSANKE